MGVKVAKLFLKRKDEYLYICLYIYVYIYTCILKNIWKEGAGVHVGSTARSSMRSWKSSKPVGLTLQFVSASPPGELRTDDRV